MSLGEKRINTLKSEGKGKEKGNNKFLRGSDKTRRNTKHQNKQSLTENKKKETIVLIINKKRAVCGIFPRVLQSIGGRVIRPPGHLRITTIITYGDSNPDIPESHGQ